MPIFKEWNCAKHGQFVATHPICPAMGCRSQTVTRAFLTAPGVVSSATKRFDAGLKKTAQIYKMSDLKSARPGESQSNGGEGVLWGTAAEKALGRPLHTGSPVFRQQLADGRVWEDRGGMREAAADFGIDQTTPRDTLSRSEVTAERNPAPLPP